jgi:hypothetical protein
MSMRMAKPWKDTRRARFPTGRFWYSIFSMQGKRMEPPQRVHGSGSTSW